MNIEQAKERLKNIVDFYKLNDENNYDYSDEVLISMRIVLEEIEKLKEEKESWKRVATKNFNKAEDYKSILKEIRECIEIQPSSLVQSEINIIKILDKVGVDKE